VVTCPSGGEERTICRDLCAPNKFRVITEPSPGYVDTARSASATHAYALAARLHLGRQYRYILRPVAKVMISLPDELLARLDEQARRRGTSRSGLLRELAERELLTDSVERRRRITRLLDGAASHGGQNVRQVREQRRAR
jgi:predicted DNA-binding protein